MSSQCLFVNETNICLIAEDNVIIQVSTDNHLVVSVIGGGNASREASLPAYEIGHALADGTPV